MFFTRSDVVAATLLILQSTFSIAAPLSGNAGHQLEKRITCQTTEVPINNACVSCASLYKNASTCTRSVPLTCSYGVVNSARKCAAIDCPDTATTYLSPNGKQCLSYCTDPNALTCNIITGAIICKSNYTFAYNRCFQPLLAKDQPFKPFVPIDNRMQECPRGQPKARVLYYTGDTPEGPGMCKGQNGPLDQNLVKSDDMTSYTVLEGFCSDFVKSPFVTANGAAASCQQVFLLPAN
ncbi:BQ2448_6280 [Microbotryum intermedium]|uniref:BQ2448_6280 protein n=1 Tax=Microbotryum intermedium TaxID=269621 RepID=A0A238FJ85_9BASI|nr:BQ2448_6280 [Microbotryum intermedium]